MVKQAIIFLVDVWITSNLKNIPNKINKLQFFVWHSMAKEFVGWLQFSGHTDESKTNWVNKAPLMRFWLSYSVQYISLQHGTLNISSGDQYNDGIRVWMGWFIWVCLKMLGIYSQWNSHLIGIMISKTIGFRGTNHFQTHPFDIWMGWVWMAWCRGAELARHECWSPANAPGGCLEGDSCREETRQWGAGGRSQEETDIAGESGEKNREKWGDFMGFHQETWRYHGDNMGITSYIHMVCVWTWLIHPKHPQTWSLYVIVIGKNDD